MKLFLLIIGILIFLFLTLFLYCSLVLAKECDEDSHI